MSEQQNFIPTISDDDIVAQEPSNITHAPNRARRGLFVAGSWLLSFGLVAYLSANVPESKMAELAIDGCTTYMIALGITYICGHSVDRADFLNKIRDLMKKD